MAPLVTIITGCSSGIGLDLAVRLAQDPSKKYLIYATMRNLAKKDALVKAAGDSLDKSLFIRQLDVTSDDQVANIYDFTAKEHGRVDIVVNNAGYGFFGPFEAMNMEHTRAIFDTNFFGTVRMIQGALPIMKKAKSGRIINISSVVGHVGFPCMDMYNATKFAMEGLVESLEPQLRDFGISISTVQPGPVKTEFGGNMFSSMSMEEMQKIVPEESMQQMQKFQRNMMEKAMSSSQESGDVTNVIVECIEAEKPLLRYPTSDFARYLLALRYGEEDFRTGATEKWLDGPGFKGV